LKPSSRPSLLGPYSTLHKGNKASIKKTKRHNKHVTLLSRIQKTAPASKITKRRRPAKKLVANLDSLADALPEAAANDTSKKGIRSELAVDGPFKIKHQSLNSRPGASKKKEKLVATERQRFALNMARMAATSSTPVFDAGQEDDAPMGEAVAKGDGKKNSCASAERWAAIRGFISQTMETRDEGLR